MESVIFDTAAIKPAWFAPRYDVAFHHAMSYAISQWWTTAVVFRCRCDSFVNDIKLLGVYYLITLVMSAIYLHSFTLFVAYDLYSFRCVAFRSQRMLVSGRLCRRRWVWLAVLPRWSNDYLDGWLSADK